MYFYPVIQTSVSFVDSKFFCYILKIYNLYSLIINVIKDFFTFLRSGAYGTLTYNFTKYHKLATIY